jgi:pimeloyl-ACP methyl ester carboxylesterase
MLTPEKPGGVRASEVRTPRLRHHVLFGGDGDGPVVVFVHGNLSTARFFEQDLAALPDGYRGIAADLRGFGHSEAAPVDAVRGVRDFADDLAELVASPEAGGAGRVHLVGWSLGGGVAMQYAIDHPASVASVTLLASMSPAGFGGTRDAEGPEPWREARRAGLDDGVEPLTCGAILFRHFRDLREHGALADLATELARAERTSQALTGLPSTSEPGRSSWPAATPPRPATPPSPASVSPQRTPPADRCNTF